MGHPLGKALVAVFLTLNNPRAPTRFDSSDEDRVQASYRSVTGDRPTAGACRKGHRPLHLRKRPLPSAATPPRRLRSRAVVALLDARERRVTAPEEPGLFGMIDGQPLPLGGCSEDRQAGYGRAAGGKAEGDELHALTGPDGTPAAWRVAPMNRGERALAARLLQAAPPEVVGYVVGDSSYDPDPLQRVCDARGGTRWGTPRRQGPGKGTGHRRPAAGRRRSLARTESPLPAFADRSLRDRAAIARRYGDLTNGGAG
jgi:hypothetical protein